MSRPLSDADARRLLDVYRRALARVDVMRFVDGTQLEAAGGCWHAIGDDGRHVQFANLETALLALDGPAAPMALSSTVNLIAFDLLVARALRALFSCRRI